MTEGRDKFSRFGDLPAAPRPPRPPLTPRQLLLALVALPLGIAVLAIGALVLGPAIDVKVHGHAFEPGRWESLDGHSSLTLNADGTGDVSLAAHGDGRPCDQPLATSLTYVFTPGQTVPYGSLALAVKDVAAPGCPASSLDVNGGGAKGGGYNWNELCVLDDQIPDSCAETLIRRD